MEILEAFDVTGTFLAELERLADGRSDGTTRTRAADGYAAVRMRDVFTLAKASVDMPLDEMERLLENPVHKARVAVVVGERDGHQAPIGDRPLLDRADAVGANA